MACVGMNVSKRMAAMPQQHEVKVESAAAGRLRRRRWLDDMSTWDFVVMTTILIVAKEEDWRIGG